MSYPRIDGCLQCQFWTPVGGDIIWGSCSNVMVWDCVKIDGKQSSNFLTYRHFSCPFRKRKTKCMKIES